MFRGRELEATLGRLPNELLGKTTSVTGLIHNSLTARPPAVKDSTLYHSCLIKDSQICKYRLIMFQKSRKCHVRLCTECCVKIGLFCLSQGRAILA